MKRRRLAVVSILGLFVGIALSSEFDSRLAAREQSVRPWFTSLPGMDEPVTPGGGARGDPAAGNRSSSIYIAGLGQICELDPATGRPSAPLFPYGPEFQGQLNFAMSTVVDANNVSSRLLITGPGDAVDHPLALFSGPPWVRLGDVPIESNSDEGVYITTGDLIGDGTLEIVVADGPQVHIIELNRDEVRTFRPFADFEGVVRLATGKINGIGHDELITVQGNGGGGLRVFEVLDDGPREVGHGFPQGPDFMGGLWVDASDFNGDGIDELVTGAGSGPPFIRVFNPATPERPSLIASFVAIHDNQTGGVRIASGHRNGRAAIAAAIGETLRLYQRRDDGAWDYDERFEDHPYGPPTRNVSFKTILLDPAPFR